MAKCFKRSFLHTLKIIGFQNIIFCDAFRELFPHYYMEYLAERKVNVELEGEAWRKLKVNEMHN